MPRYHGKKGKIYLQGSGSEAVPLAVMAEWELNLEADRADATSFDDTNIVEYPSWPKLSGSFSGFWDNTAETLFDAQDSTSGRKMYIYPSLDAATIYWYGTAFVDAKIGGGVKDMVKVSGTFSAASSWTRQWA